MSQELEQQQSTETKISLGELADALSKAQGEMDSAKKDSANPFFKSKYADLASVIKALKEPFSKNGLAYIQLIETTDDGKTFVKTSLIHKSGQSISCRMLAKPMKEDMQALGSAITYARRYTLQAIAGVPADDDDGEASMGRNEIPRTSQVQRPPPQEEKTRTKINDDELRELLSLAVAKNNYTVPEVEEYVKSLGYEKTSDLNPWDYEDTMRHFGEPKKKESKKDK